MSIRITDPVDGDILNRLHGTVTGDGLEISVRGVCSPGAKIRVNGERADVAGGKFSARVCLSQRENKVTAQTEEVCDSILVLYDKGSFRRYRFSLDDNIWFLRDIAQRQCRSLFENPYMALWKRLHDTYGTKFVCNIYYQCEDFNLTMMSDRYRGEWADNADWFHLTFHALQNDPPNPYINATYEEMARDYDLVVNEILRFAGEEVMDTFTTIHWGEATVEACRAVRDRGLKGLCAYFLLRDETPAVALYLDRAHTEHLSQRDYWKDTKEDLIFVRHAVVLNSGGLEGPNIASHFERLLANPCQGEVLELMIHEQYFYPEWVGFLPNYAERCEAAVRWVTDNGYRPVFYCDGFVGTPVEGQWAAKCATVAKEE